MFIFYELFLVFLHSFAGKSFVVVVLDFFFIWEPKKWSLVALKSNDLMGICLGGLSIGRFTEVVWWEFAWADSALVVLQRWSFEQVSL